MPCNRMFGLAVFVASLCAPGSSAFEKPDPFYISQIVDLSSAVGHLPYVPVYTDPVASNRVLYGIYFIGNRDIPVTMFFKDARQFGNRIGIAVNPVILDHLGVQSAFELEVSIFPEL